MPRGNLLQVRAGTAAAWTTANPVLAAAEPGFETDTGKLKIGDGATTWASLAYAAGAAAIAAAIASAGATTQTTTLTPTAPPTISGTTVVGNALTASTGSWSVATSSLTFAYQWNRNGTAISGATASTYTQVAADVGDTVSCTVTATLATSSSGSVTATGTATGVTVSAAPAAGTPTLVQQKTTSASSSSSATMAASLAANVTGGNALILVASNFTNDAITSITGGGVTWKLATQQILNSGGGSSTAEIWYGLASTGGAGTEPITITFSYTTYNAVVTISEWSNVGSFDVAAGYSNAAAATTVTTPSITPSEAGELLIAVGSSGVMSANTAPFSQLGTFNAVATGYGSASYYVDTAAASISTSWTNGSSATFTSAIAAFCVGATPTTPTTYQPTMTTGAASSAGLTGATWDLAFEDEFAGTTLDTTRWKALSTSMNNVTTSPANVSVVGGNLVLTLSSASSGAEIDSAPYDGAGANGFTVGVGDFVEARVNFPGSGSTSYYNWPAFWISGPNWPVNGELDIAEVLSNTLTCGNYHYGTSSASYSNNGPSYGSATTPGTFHVYGLYRGTSNYYVFCDGALIRTVARNADDQGGAAAILLNIGTAGTAVTGSASNMLVDYVRAWVPA